MKTTLSVFLLLIANSDLLARQLPPINDTLIISQIVNRESVIIDTLEYRDTLMKTIYLRNDQSEAVSISRSWWSGQDNNNYSVELLKSSFIMLPDEVIKVANMSIQHLSSKSGTERGFLNFDSIAFGTNIFRYKSSTYRVVLKLTDLLSKPCFEVGYEKSTIGPTAIDGIDSVMMTFFSNRTEPVNVSASTISEDKESFDFLNLKIFQIPALSYVALPIYYKPRSDAQVMKDRHVIQLKLSGDWDNAVCTTYTVTMVGVTQTASVNDKTEKNGFLSIHPNPMSESVMIRAEEMRNASIEIYNILGELVYRSIGSELNWNRLTTSGSRAPAGTYIVRVSGIEDRGFRVKSAKILAQ